MRGLTRKQKLSPERPICQTGILRLSHDGRGVGEVDGKKTFIFGGLPNEVVSFQYTSVRRRLDEGRAIDITMPSPFRTAPHCAHFGVCGGCQLQHLEPEAQLEHKQAVMLEQLQHLGGVTPREVLAPLTGPLWGYRRKARLGVRFVQKKNKLLIGFRERQANKLADLSECSILVPEFGSLIPDLQRLIAGLAGFEVIPQIEISVGTGPDERGLVIRHLAPLSESDVDKLKAFAKTNQICLFLQAKGPESVQCLWPDPDKRFLSYILEPYHLKFEFHPSDFTQVNHEMNEQMVARALSLLEPKSTDRILDLFCGIGNFSLPLAMQAEKVVGVEGHAEAVRRAQHNATLNQIENVQFYAQDLTKPLDPAWASAQYDLVLLDPPRSGALEMMPHLVAWGPRRILYISCQPATMARDAAILVESGYQLVKAGVMDMFPHTAHVESLALFEK
ncbi:MAG: 23S rRNA (uracil(1939)-C(5))-methyltransferase RlmD [Gammaproteobacteria bacterium]